MEKASYIFRSAGSALAIAVAVASAPSVAQDAGDPAPVVVATMPASQPDPKVPAIVVPEVVTVQPPTVSQVPPADITSTQAEPGRSPAPAEPVRATSEPAGISRVANRSSAAALNDASSSRDVPLGSGSVPAPIAAAIDRADGASGRAAMDSADGAGDRRALPATPTQAPGAGGIDDNEASLVMGGGALALALGLASLFVAGAKRRRRQAASDGDRTKSARMKPATDVGDQVEPVAAAPHGATGRFSLSHTVSRPFGVSKWDDPMYVNASPLAVSGRSVPDTPAGRKALIDRLVRANPDRTNPFRSSSARRRRARLIVQSLRTTMAQQPNLDFRRFYESFGRRNALPA